MERISETLIAHYHRMQHFITDSNWEARAVMDLMVYKFYREMTDEMMLGKLQQRHERRQSDIDYYYLQS